MDKAKKEIYEKTLDKILETELVVLEDRESAVEIIGNIKENKISMSVFSKYPELLNVKSNKVRNVVNAFIASELPLGIIEKNPEVIDRTNATRIEKNAKLFREEDLSFNIFERFPEILAIGNDENMAQILKIFDEKIINRRFFVNAGDVLAYANAEELEKIMEVLDIEDLFNLVLKKEPSVLYSNSQRVVKQIIELFKDPKEKLGMQLLKQDLKLLSRTTRVRIVAILNVLERAGVSRIAVKTSPEILYSNETKVIESHISELKSRDISKDLIARIPEILAKEKINKELEIVDYINENEKVFFDVLEKYPKVILEAEIEKLREYVQYVEKEILPSNIVSIAPEVLTKNTAGNVERILDNLKDINEENYHKDFPTILNIQDPDNIKEIAEVFEELNLPKKIYQTSVSVFLEGDAQNIREIVEEIDSKQIGRDILQNSFILARGNPENITKIIDKFESSENVSLGKDLLKRSGTILAQGDVDKIDGITRILEEYGFIEEGSNIPASIYAKGNPEQMEEIYEFMNSIGLLQGLKSSMTLFIRPIDNIKENVNLLIEHGLFEDFIDNVSVLGLSPQTVEKRIVYLESIGERPTIPILKLNNNDFYNQFNINEKDLDKVKEKPLSQTIIENKYANYIYNDAKFLNLEGLKAVSEIYKQIEELGIINKNLEYVKKGYSYSVIKIKENIHKIISNISDYNNISFLEMTDIYTMSILGNKKVDEKEINSIRESIKIRELEEVKEISTQQILELPKIEVSDTEIVKESDIVEIDVDTNAELEEAETDMDTDLGMDEEAETLEIEKDIEEFQLIPENTDEVEVVDIELIDEEEPIEIDEVMEGQTEIENAFDDLETVDGVDIDDLDSIDDFNKISGVKKDQLVFPEDEEDFKFEDQVEINLDEISGDTLIDDLKVMLETNETDGKEELSIEELEDEVRELIAEDKVEDEVESEEELSDKEKMLAQMKAEIAEMNKTLQEIRFQKELENVEKAKQDLEEQIKAELVEDEKEVEAEEIIEEVLEEEIDEDFKLMPEKEEIVIASTDEEDSDEEIDQSKIFDEIIIEEGLDDEREINIDEIDEEQRIKIAADSQDEFIDFNEEDPKIFFGLDDYGYFAKYTESEDMTRLQMQLNEIYKQKKNQEEDY